MGGWLSVEKKGAEKSRGHKGDSLSLCVSLAEDSQCHRDTSLTEERSVLFTPETTLSRIYHTLKRIDPSQLNLVVIEEGFTAAKSAFAASQMHGGSLKNGSSSKRIT